MKTYTGSDPYHGLDYLLTIHDTGELELATRPVMRDAWTMWSAPITLAPESSGAAS